jgi:hypothetical protein
MNRRSIQFLIALSDGNMNYGFSQLNVATFSQMPGADRIHEQTEEKNKIVIGG